MDSLVKCADDDEPVAPAHRPRGTAGVAILWPKITSKQIIPLQDGGNRVAAVKVQTERGSLVLINTYMPTIGTHSGADYSETLDEVLEIVEKYADCMIIWTGDINASVNRRHLTSNDKKFAAFCEENSLVISSHTPNLPTYHHFNGTSTSTIDYFVTLKTQSDSISSVTVEERNPLNCSSHDGITATLDLDLQPDEQKATVQNLLPSRVKWDRVDVDLYYQLTDEAVTALHDSITENTPTDLIVTRLTDILQDVSAGCQPKPAKKPRKKTKFTWGIELSPYMKQSKQAHAKWKHGGDPLTQTTSST